MFTNLRFHYYDLGSVAIFALITHHINSLCLDFFHLLARMPNLEKRSIYSSKFFHNFHLSESRFICPVIQTSALAPRLQKCKKVMGIEYHDSL